MIPPESNNPESFADLLTSPAYPQWVKPEPSDRPTKHRRTYTFLRAMAANWDTLAASFKAAAWCHGSQTAPNDALEPLGETYGGLARALRDNDTTYRAYLKNPLSRWYKFGTKAGMLGELAHLGYPNAQIVSWRNLVDAGAGSPGVVFGGYTAFFFVALFMPNSFGESFAHWGAGDGRWGVGDAAWGGAPASGDYLAELRRVIAMTKPAHTSCRHIVAFHDTVSGLDAQLLPTGNFDVYPVNEPWERVRPSYASNPFYTTSPLVP